ncbi:MAG TPA: Druantia anti-phage system protein DruA, partial [Negativicutes bacterium]|nr:Druantia anti-phage system protein DruA [Negativicutes bacterium]
MLNREIPFRPKLEGEFRVRFYTAVSVICADTSVIEIEKIANNEIEWVEEHCSYNIAQRKKYRAVWFLFRDLVHASWKACYRDGVLFMSLPTLKGADLHDAASPEIKALLRSWMQESRHERLVTYSDFINRMEKENPSKHNIAELIADGNELAGRLERANNGAIEASAAVIPYLQLVKENERDVYTGLKISEIWRYFRLTWATPAETTPGRTMQYLIRDAAHPMHAVIGIASLENCAVQITCRDDYIGWNQKAYIEKMLELSSDEAKKRFSVLLAYLEDGIDSIDYSELCTKASVQEPTTEDIQFLLDEAVNAESDRQNLLRDSLENELSEDEKSELGSISKETEVALYRRKRADQLARLLIAKKAINDLLFSSSFSDKWVDFCKSEQGNSVIRTALVAQKTKHIGSSMMELNVCGAIPPYNEILGGKLVALIALSPQIVHDYKERYSDKHSEIASRLKGIAVCRPADLVYVGTTSLYYVGSSQYNRLKIPREVFNSSSDVIWKQLGMTIGFGSMHISKATTLSLTEATSDGFCRINHVFGEGASPKMRLLTMAIRELLESTNEDSKDFSKHAMSRIVYGACLADNTFDYLLGMDTTPHYYTNMADYKAGTQRIIDYWTSRWLVSRLHYTPIYERIRNFNKQGFLVSNQIGEDEEWSFSKLKEVEDMPGADNAKTGLQFLRDFYRGSSGYADHIDSALLSKIHLETKLDKAIVDAVIAGKDIVLTGNPGDGKTHIIRMLKQKLEELEHPVIIELDASTHSSQELYSIWDAARKATTPFVIAINAAVLYSLYQSYPDFEPVKVAYAQMSNAVVFHSEVDPVVSLVVFDLSKREVLTEEILSQAIAKLTSPFHYEECSVCPMHKTCEVHKNLRLLQNTVFQKRLVIIMERVSLQGYHATLRELQSFIAYLIFGNRSCKRITETTGNSEYAVANLVYSGNGGLFKAIKRALDPIAISHPIWDEKILLNDISPETWVVGCLVSAETIAFDNEAVFQLRKRQFFLFNESGEELLNILDDDVVHFQSFLRQDDKKCVKELIRKLNAFFGAAKPSNSELQIWSGHRYDNEPRKVLISLGSIKSSGFRIGHPVLLTSMKSGIDMAANYIRLEKKDASGIFLKVDFDMYLLLAETERGVPVLFMESDLVKKVWRFIEQLQSIEETAEDEDIHVSL